MTKLLTLATMAVLLMVLAGCNGTRPTAEPRRPLETPVVRGPSETATPPERPTPTAVPGPGERPTPRPVPVPTAVPAPVVTPTPTVEVVPGLPADSFVAVVPRTLRTGYMERVSVSLFNGDRPVSGTVRLTLLHEGSSVGAMAARVEGAANLALPVPRVAPGPYEIEVQVEGVSETRRAPLRVEQGVLLFVETDKPIYKPGQTVHVRLMTLDALLKPWQSDATIEVQDAKGIKVFKREVATDEYGMATVDLPLSTEPNLGVWKLTALAGDRKTQLDVRVEEYVLPKYRVAIDTEKDWVLTGEPIQGVLSGEYSFGKPVVGEFEIVAWRYVGQWEEYARSSGSIEGDTTFSIPPVRYVAGVPAAGGQGNVRLDVAIREKGAGYEESTSKLITVAAAPVVLKVIPENRVFKPGLDMAYLVVAQEPDGSPVDTDVTVTISYVDKKFEEAGRETIEVATSGGKAMVETSPPSKAVQLSLTAEADGALCLDCAAVGLLPLGQLHPRRAADPGRRTGGGYAPVPGQLHQRGPQLLLRGALQGHRNLHRRVLGPGYRAGGDAPNGALVPDPRVPGPAQQRDRRRLPSLRS